MKTFGKTLCVMLMLACVSCGRGSYTLTGYVEGDFTYISSLVAGTLKDVSVRRGDAVKKDQLLFQLDPEPENSDFISAQKHYEEMVAKLADIESGGRTTQLGIIRGQLDDAKAELNLAQIRLNRNRELVRKKAIEQDAYDAALAGYKKAEAKVSSLTSQLAEAELGGRENVVNAQIAARDVSRAQMQKAEWLLKQKMGYAPLDARVFDTYYQKGEFIPAGRPILSLLVSKDIHVVFFLTGAEVSEIQLGQEIEVYCTGCRDAIIANVEYISPVAEYTPPVIYSRENQSQLVFRVHAHPKDVSKFHPGQSVTLSITPRPSK